MKIARVVTRYLQTRLSCNARPQFTTVAMPTFAPVFYAQHQIFLMAWKVHWYAKPGLAKHYSSFQSTYSTGLRQNNPRITFEDRVRKPNIWLYADIDKGFKMLLLCAKWHWIRKRTNSNDWARMAEQTGNLTLHMPTGLDSSVLRPYHSSKLICLDPTCLTTFNSILFMFHRLPT